MHLVLVHYHLNRGGVTRVIRNHLTALAGIADNRRPDGVTILHGGRASGWEPLPEDVTDRLPVEIVTLPQLRYTDETTTERVSVANLTATLTEALTDRHLTPEATVLHWHNHSLGKTPAIPGTIAELARAGWRLLLQIHDFAEEFRPDNYRLLREMWSDIPKVLYPQANHIRYGVLNGRDEGVLAGAGLDRSRLHRLPNPVALSIQQPDRTAVRERLREETGIPPEVPFVLYPVRGIRRKNIGELCLWAALFAETHRFGITLTPMNPIEREAFDRWVRFCEAQNLRVVFGIGDAGRLTFEENLAASDLTITTSLAEGFGLVFLESWLVDQRLIGRDLPEISADFREEGLNLDDLGAQVSVPLDLFDQLRWQNDLKSVNDGVRVAYGLPEQTDAEFLEACVQLIHPDGTGADAVDFATFSTDRQRDLIARVTGTATVRERMLAANPWMSDSLSPDASHPLVAENREVVEQRYSLAACGERLTDVYNRLIETEPEDTVSPLPHPDHILSEFVRVSRLNPVRLEATP